ncbi:MAG: TraG domain-containing protein, partial [Sphingobacteriia bacterium]|nr:TraG domain-containing protein [Sphingobacteriia bacterium]
IQLWQPILAVINLYIILTTQGKLDALRNAGMGNLELPSIFALWKLDFILSDYLGVGGMLAASTPAISLMLIYGSAVTATHLAGRLQGGDHINEKIASPDAVNPAAALSMGSLKTHAPLTGTTTPNANSVLWSADVGRSMQDSVRSGEQAVQQASSRFSSSLAGTASASASRSGESFASRSMNWDYGATGSATDRAIMSEARGLTDKYERSGMSTQQMAGIVSGAIAAKGRSGGDEGSLAGDLSTQLRSQYITDVKLADTMAADIARRVSGDSGFEARLAESIRADSQSGSRNVFAERLSSDESARLEKDAADVVSSSRSLEREQLLARRYGAMGTYGAAEIGNAIANDPELMDRLHR